MEVQDGWSFGGKETQANHTPPGRLCSPITPNARQKSASSATTTRRSPASGTHFFFHYKVGFNSEGQLLALDVEQHSDAGCATGPEHGHPRACDAACRQLLHPDMRVTGRAYRTNLPSNTAFRGSGGPQGDGLVWRRSSTTCPSPRHGSARRSKEEFYGRTATSHFGQQVELNRIHVICEQLERSSDYKIRRESVRAFNERNEFLKRGIATTPVKFWHLVHHHLPQPQEHRQHLHRRHPVGQPRRNGRWAVASHIQLDRPDRRYRTGRGAWSG